MIWDEMKRIKSGPKELKEFGITFGAVFLILASLIFWFKHTVPIYLFSLSLLFFVLAFLFPGVMKPLQKIWMGLALVLGWMMSHIILGVLFFLVVTPIAIFVRLQQKKFMETKIDRAAKSYWHERETKTFDKVACETQY